MRTRGLAVSLAASFLAAPVLAQSWTKLSPTTNPGTRTAGHVMANDFLRRKCVMAGAGVTAEWDGKTWKTFSSTLPNLFYPTISFDLPRRRTVLFAGRIGGARQNKTYEWDGSKWTEIKTASAPSARYGGCQAYDWARRQTVQFSGLDGSPYAADTQVFDGKTWKQVATTGPKGRIYPAMCYDQRRQKCVMFAGYALGDLKDTWEWDGKAWKEIKTKTVPPQRWGHVMVYDFARGVTVMYGGYTSSGRTAHNDTWIYNGIDWKQVKPTTSPGGRRLMAGAYDNANGKTLIYGGTGGGASDTWHFDVGTPASYTTFGTGCKGTGGIPALAAAQGSLPKLNATFTSEVRNIPKTAPVAMLLGFSSTNWASFSLPLKLDGIGANGCNLLVSPDILTPLVNTNGVAKLQIPIPNNNSLLGVFWFDQALVIDPKANRFGGVFTNGAAAKVGN